MARHFISRGPRSQPNCIFRLASHVLTYAVCICSSQRAQLSSSAHLNWIALLHSGTSRMRCSCVLPLRAWYHAPCLVPRRLALLRLHNCTLLPAVKAIQLCWRAASSAILQSLALCIYAAAAGQWLPPLKTNVCQGERTTVQNYFVQIYQPNLRLELKTDRSIKFHRQPYQIRLQEQRKLY